MVIIMGVKNYKNTNYAKDITRKKNHKKCKPKFNPRLETQIHKAKTQYMLEDDLDITSMYENKGYDNKTYPKLMFNIMKVIRSPTPIYTPLVTHSYAP
jgi:transcriptional/translational regulatory protein YebC/TACO1